ncbi:hypothetical protein PVAP13_7NG360325, partial [Panicum virgatum]
SPTTPRPSAWRRLPSSSEELSALDEKVVAFNYLTSIFNFHIISCPSLVLCSFQTFIEFIYDILHINDCPRLLSPRKMLHGSYNVIHRSCLHCLQDT